MISRNDVIAWGVDHQWPELDQIEQDLLLSQAMCVISDDPLLSEELVLRGGTAFHKLFLPEPYRYSEDLDYVRLTEGGIGPIMRRITDIGHDLGYDVSTKMSMYPKVYWRFQSISGAKGKIKIEINTYERISSVGILSKCFSVNSPFYMGNTDIKTLHSEELIATKIRALYQRSKGRDLYDIWLALTELNMDTDAVLKAFPLYRPEGLSRDEIIANLRLKLKDPSFVTDVNNLKKHDAPDYDALAAGEYIIDELLSKL